MKSIIATILLTLLTGCSTMPAGLKSGFDGRDYWPDRAPQNPSTREYGELAPGSVNSYSGAPSRGQFTPHTVQFGSSNYLVVPNYTTGRTQAIIRTTR